MMLNSSLMEMIQTDHNLENIGKPMNLMFDCPRAFA
jgi:hypothetical protein